MPGSFRNDFRRFFVRGLAAVLPTLLTLMIIIFVFRFIHNYVGVYINSAVIYVLDRILVDTTKEQLLQLWQKHWYLQGVGFVLAIIGIYFMGHFVASFVGRSIWAVIEHTLTRAPVIKQIYPSAKQVTDFLLRERKAEFSRVVAVEYPRKGIWSVGLVTGSGMRAIRERLASDLLTVFIPSSPTPVTGYTITVHREDVIDLPLSIDEALRFTVSGGVLVPPSQRLPGSLDRAITQGSPTQLEKTEPDGTEKQQNGQQKVTETPKREEAS